LRIKVELIAENNVILPRGYNAIIQGLIYSFFNDFQSRWLHDQGFSYEKRTFRLFNFSSFLERAKYFQDSQIFKFPRKLSFYFSSPINYITEHFAVNFIKQNHIWVYDQKCMISSVNVYKNPEITNNNININAISPIEVHSTIQDENGKIKTIYHNAFEESFNNLVNQNLKKKWTAAIKQACPHDISIKPLFKKDWKEKIQYFRKKIGSEIQLIVIKGWQGKFNLQGHPDFLSFAYQTGLGSRNSSGFGMFELE
jgi:CRISPR-associated endoribonuclease Cas6